MPRCFSISIQSLVAWRLALRALTDPAIWIAPPNSSSFSVSVVLPASGCEMMAKVRRFLTSRARAESPVCTGAVWVDYIGGKAVNSNLAFYRRRGNLSSGCANQALACVQHSTASPDRQPERGALGCHLTLYRSVRQHPSCLAGCGRPFSFNLLGVDHENPQDCCPRFRLHRPGWRSAGAPRNVRARQGLGCL